MLYQHVLEANQAGRNISRPGITARRVDEACRQVLRNNNLDDHFTHRTGHGLGLEPHEPPYIHSENDLILQPGMAFTVEPGYISPEWEGFGSKMMSLLTKKAQSVSPVCQEN